MNANMDLPPEDVEYLNANYAGQYTLLTDGPGKHGLFVDRFPIPEGYDTDTATLLVLISSGYPGSALDMFYFDPQLARIDGKQIAALAEESHFGRTWQRWSRHYEWKPGEHSIVSHVESVKEQLRIEVSR